jgi:hypothetical protein
MTGGGLGTKIGAIAAILLSEIGCSHLQDDGVNTENNISDLENREFLLSDPGQTVRYSQADMDRRFRQETMRILTSISPTDSELCCVLMGEEAAAMSVAVNLFLEGDGARLADYAISVEQDNDQFRVVFMPKYVAEHQLEIEGFWYPDPDGNRLPEVYYIVSRRSLEIIDIGRVSH